MAIISEDNKKVLISRVKSFLWRLGGALAVVLLNFIGDQLSLFDLPVWAVGLISLGVGEATKYFIINLPELRANKTNQ